jgi:hypothetical protein
MCWSAWSSRLAILVALSAILAVLAKIALTLILMLWAIVGLGILLGFLALFLGRRVVRRAQSVTGTTKWSRTYEGKQSVLVKLFGPLRAKSTAELEPRRVVSSQKETTRCGGSAGKQHDKERGALQRYYCFVFRLSGHQLKEVTDFVQQFPGARGCKRDPGPSCMKTQTSGRLHGVQTP